MINALKQKPFQHTRNVSKNRKKRGVNNRNNHVIVDLMQ